MPELKVLLSRDQIAERVSQMGQEISRDFAGQSVVLLGVLKGAAIFLSDLARHVDLDATFDFIGVSSYGKRPSAAQVLEGTGTTETWDSTGEVRLTIIAIESRIIAPDMQRQKREFANRRLLPVGRQAG